MDLAILKTGRPIWGAAGRGLPLCPGPLPEIFHRLTLFGTCGMGSLITAKRSYSFPIVLQETFFSLSNFKYRNNSEACRADNICTVPLLESSNICFMDQGGPLYKFKCGTLEPECLYGIASYSMDRFDTPNRVCNNGSFFVDLSVFSQWIQYHLINS